MKVLKQLALKTDTHNRLKFLAVDMNLNLKDTVKYLVANNSDITSPNLRDFKYLKDKTLHQINLPEDTFEALKAYKKRNGLFFYEAIDKLILATLENKIPNNELSTIQSAVNKDLYETVQLGKKNNA